MTCAPLVAAILAAPAEGILASGVLPGRSGMLYLPRGFWYPLSSANGKTSLSWVRNLWVGRPYLRGCSPEEVG